MILYCNQNKIPSLKKLKKYYDMMENGETIIIFFKIFRITELHDNLEICKFKQLRLCEWIYSTCEDLYFLTCVKKSKPTFNSKYDNGLYNVNFHKFISTLILKHTKQDELIRWIF